MRVLAAIVSLVLAMHVAALVPRMEKNCDANPGCLTLAKLSPSCIADPKCSCTLDHAVDALTCFHCIAGLGNQTATDAAQKDMNEAGNACAMAGHPVGISCTQ